MSERASGDGVDPLPAATVPAAELIPAPPPVEPDPGAAPPYVAEQLVHGPGLPAAPYAVLPYPVTAAPYPVTAAPYPVTAAPYPYAFVAPPPRRNGWTIALGITAGVLLLAVGALGALWFLDHDEATRTSSDQQAQLEDLQEQVAQLEEDLDETETRLQVTEDDLATAQACPEAVQEFVELAAESPGEAGAPSPQAQQAAFEMFNACGVAP
jgi:hypothetical protein